MPLEGCPVKYCCLFICPALALHNKCNRFVEHYDMLCCSPYFGRNSRLHILPFLCCKVKHLLYGEQPFFVWKHPFPLHGNSSFAVKFPPTSRRNIPNPVIHSDTPSCNVGCPVERKVVLRTDPRITLIFKVQLQSFLFILATVIIYTIIFLR